MKKLVSSIVLICVLLVCLVAVSSCKKADNGENQSKADTSKAASPSKAEPKETSDMIPLPTKLPKPMFVGTPTNVVVPNLETPLGSERPIFYVPAGTTNLAAGKNVTASDDMPIIGDISMIVDGDKEASDGSYVELAPFLQYVTIDLGEEANIYAVLLWHYHKQAIVQFDVIVQVADDPDFVTNVKTIFNNDDDNSAGLGVGTDKNYVETYEGKLIDAKGVKGRYVRLYSNGNSSNELNHYIEVEVFGKPVK